MPIWLISAGKFLGIRGGIAVALGIALAVTMWRADSISEDRDEARQAYAASEARHSITRQSLSLLEGKLADMIEAGKATEANVEKAVEEAKRESDTLRAQAGRIGAVEGVDCETPREIMEADL